MFLLFLCVAAAAVSVMVVVLWLRVFCEGRYSRVKRLPRAVRLDVLCVCVCVGCVLWDGVCGSSLQQRWVMGLKCECEGFTFCLSIVSFCVSLFIFNRVPKAESSLWTERRTMCSFRQWHSDLQSLLKSVFVVLLTLE